MRVIAIEEHSWLQHLPAAAMRAVCRRHRSADLLGRLPLHPTTLRHERCWTRRRSVPASGRNLRTAWWRRCWGCESPPPARHHRVRVRSGCLGGDVGVLWGDAARSGSAMVNVVPVPAP